jgi:hypothetical protein
MTQTTVNRHLGFFRACCRGVVYETLTTNRRLEDADHQSKVRSLPKNFRENCEKGDSADGNLKSCSRVLANLRWARRSLSIG